MSAKGRGSIVVDHENYPTPSWTVHRFLEEVQLPGGLWLEPCAGAGAIVRAVNQVRSDVTWHMTEIRRECEAPLRRLGHARFGDFLYLGQGIEDGEYDVIITNPPFSRAQEIVEASLPLATWVVMLLRLNWLGSAARAAMLRDVCPDVYVLPDRPSFKGDGGTDATEYAWMVWGPQRRPVTYGRGYSSMPASIQVLAPTPQTERRTW